MSEWMNIEIGLVDPLLQLANFRWCWCSTPLFAILCPSKATKDPCYTQKQNNWNTNIAIITPYQGRVPCYI